jgi:hypothetical protein
VASADSLFAVSYMNDWTQKHIAGCEPGSERGQGPVVTRPRRGVSVDDDQLGALCTALRDDGWQSDRGGF